MKFGKNYANEFTEINDQQMKIDLNNVTKGYSKDFIFEIHFEASENPNSLPNIIEICIASSTFYASSLSGKKYELSKDLNLKICNESEDVKIQENEEVKKHLMRVQASEIIEKAQVLFDRNDYKQGEDMLGACCDMLEDYKQDKILGSLQTNIKKQKQMAVNSRMGVQNQMKMSSYAKSMVQAYNCQESIPCCGDMYQNRTKQAFQTKLQKSKN